MALIVEDGSVVADADSFVSLVDARARAELIGLTLPVDDTECEVALRKGGIYVNGQDSTLTGSRVSGEQTMCYPRTGATRYTFDLAITSIPTEAIDAQLSAAASIGAGTVVHKVSDGREVQSVEVVGAVKKSYFQSSASATNELSESISYLNPLSKSFENGSSGVLFDVTRT